MKTILLVLFVAICITSCQVTSYTGSYGQINQSQVVLSEANFIVLGSFTGTATEKKYKMSVKDQEGLISLAKTTLLQNAAAAGAELKGSRALINVAVDIVQNKNVATVTVSGDIIEFTK
jgi:hypothetical protein